MDVRCAPWNVYVIWSLLPKVLLFHIGNLDVAWFSEVKSIIVNNHFTIKHFGNDILEIQENISSRHLLQAVWQCSSGTKMYISDKSDEPSFSKAACMSY